MNNLVRSLNTGNFITRAEKKEQYLNLLRAKTKKHFIRYSHLGHY